MTAILSTENGPCIMRTIAGAGGATFELREWPVQIARHRSVNENRPATSKAHRDARGRFDGRRVFG